MECSVEEPVQLAHQFGPGRLGGGQDVVAAVEQPQRVMGRYVLWVLRAAETDPHVARRFLAVSGLVASPSTLFAPGVLGPVLSRIPRRAGSQAEHPDLVGV